MRNTNPTSGSKLLSSVPTLSNEILIFDLVYKQQTFFSRMLDASLAADQDCVHLKKIINGAKIFPHWSESYMRTTLISESSGDIGKKKERKYIVVDNSVKLYLRFECLPRTTDKELTNTVVCPKLIYQATQM